MNDYLLNLLGHRFWAAHRSLNLHTWQFGERVTRLRRDGSEQVVGRYALHVQCAWRIVASNTILVGSRDQLTPRGNPSVVPEGFSPNEPRCTLCDERLEAYLGAPDGALPMVADVSTGDCGSFRIKFTNGDVLEVFPDGSVDEQWRFIDNRPGEEPEHHVFTMEADQG